MRVFFGQVILILSVCLFAQNSHAQIYGNEWINYNQKYYAFKVVNSGIQRLDYNALNSALVSTGDDISLINTNYRIIFLLII